MSPDSTPSLRRQILVCRDSRSQLVDGLSQVSDLLSPERHVHEAPPGVEAAFEEERVEAAVVAEEDLILHELDG